MSTGKQMGRLERAARARAAISAPGNSGYRLTRVWGPSVAAGGILRSGRDSASCPALRRPRKAEIALPEKPLPTCAAKARGCSSIAAALFEARLIDRP